jgi:hypothetical protein
MGTFGDCEDAPRNSHDRATHRVEAVDESVGVRRHDANDSIPEAGVVCIVFEACVVYVSQSWSK